MASTDMVIALNEADQVIDVDSAYSLLRHIITHSETPTVPVDDPAPRVREKTKHIIEFFAADGEALEVVISDAWQRFELISTGRRADVGELRRRMETILEHRFTAIAAEAQPPHVEMPTGRTWEEFLQSCADLVGGHQQRSVAGPDRRSRRGWWHNTFVHGGNV